MKFVAEQYLMELITHYVHLVPVLENLQWLQKAFLKIIYVVVLIRIDGIAHCARNHVIMMRP
ncbi:MAG: hypothetical protein L0H55_15840 [Candidatus Nitrosocosmicus sp.]|nr:hypothetical protein [Candidatus Nitrosocosmicus sp.]